MWVSIANNNKQRVFILDKDAINELIIHNSPAKKENEEDKYDMELKEKCKFSTTKGYSGFG